jgi:hypothetical protein
VRPDKVLYVPVDAFFGKNRVGDEEGQEGGRAKEEIADDKAPDERPIASEESIAR